MDFLVRAAKKDDLDSLLDLASQTGVGMTSLPADPELLANKIQNSENSFKIDPTKPGSESYFFVLEQNGKIEACASIKAKSGGYVPAYFYQIKTAQHSFDFQSSQSSGLNRHISTEVPFLQLTEIHDGPTVISSLFVNPKSRRQGFGLMTSLARFLFMADFPKRFESLVTAEMRGVIDPEGKSPFWEAIVKHFFAMEFAQADYLSVKDKSFIAELMPKHPIYIPLLDKQVQAAIAEVHTNTEPALKFLLDQGFKKDGFVDIFDAGPRVSSELHQIHSIKNSNLLPLEISKDSLEQNALVSNSKLDFRLCKANISLGSESIKLDAKTAEILKLESGDKVRALVL